MEGEVELRRADPHLKAMTDRSHPEEARIAGSAANEVSVKESAVNAKANAVVAPPVPANRKQLSRKPVGQALGQRAFFGEPFGSFSLSEEGGRRPDVVGIHTKRVTTGKQLNKNLRLSRRVI